MRAAAEFPDNPVSPTKDSLWSDGPNFFNDNLLRMIRLGRHIGPKPAATVASHEADADGNECGPLALVARRKLAMSGIAGRWKVGCHVPAASVQ